jgi:hypothetical protein
MRQVFIGSGRAAVAVHPVYGSGYARIFSCSAVFLKPQLPCSAVSEIIFLPGSEYECRGAGMQLPGDYKKYFFLCVTVRILYVAHFPL